MSIPLSHDSSSLNSFCYKSSIQGQSVMAHTFNLTTSGSRWTSEESQLSQDYIVITAPNMILCTRDLGGWDRHAMQTVSSFTERKGMEKGGGKSLWGQGWWKRDWEWVRMRERYRERKREIGRVLPFKGTKHCGRHDAGVTHSARYPKGQGQMCQNANNNPVSTRTKIKKNKKKKSSNQNENSLRFTIQFHSI